MFNLYKYRKSQSPKPQNKKRSISTVQSYKRIMDWGKNMSPSSIDTLKHGAVMIKHPSSHEFRTRERRKEKAGNVYIRHYAKSAERAITASKDFRDTHLELGQYNENSPHNSIDWMRPNTVKRRLKVFKREVKVTDLYDKEPLKMECYHKPKYRIEEKERWRSSNGFYNPKVENGSAWGKVPIYISEPYSDGFETTGDLTRKREKTKENSSKEFRVTKSIETSSNWDSIRSYLETRCSDLLSQKSYPTSFKSFF